MEDLMRAALSNALAAAALAAAVGGLSLFLARRPAVLHGLWVVVLLKLVTPPLFEVAVGPVEVAGPVREPDFEGAAAPLVLTFEPGPLEDFEDGADAAAEPPTPSPEGFESPAPAVEPPWAIDPALAWKVLGCAWAGGSLATLVLATARILRFRRVLRQASPAGFRIEGEVASLAADMGLRRPPLVDLVDARITPMIWGLALRPRLILPRELWKGLDARSRTLLLTHELAHLKRGDHRLRLLELAVTVLYWWLPVVWWARRALRDVEEQCCDAWVVWMFPDDARTYAETLLDTVDFLNPSADPEPLLASGFGKVQHLRKRLTMVMKGTTPRALGWKGSVITLGLAGTLLPMSPTWAQKPPEAEAARSSDFTYEAVLVGRSPKDAGEAVLIRSGDGFETLEALGTGSISTGATTLFVSDDDKKSKDGDKPKDGDKAEEGDKRKEGAKRAELRREIRIFPAQGDPRAAGALKRAAEQIAEQIKEIEEKQPAGEARDAQVKALKAAVEKLKQLGDQKPVEIEVRGESIRREVGETFDPAAIKGGRTLQFGDVLVRRSDRDDPKAAEARKQVEELRKVLAEKQKEMSEAAKNLAKAQAEFSKLTGEMMRIDPKLNFQVSGFRDFAAARAAVPPPKREDDDKARIDALEQKLDRILKQLDGLKKAEGDSKK